MYTESEYKKEKNKGTEKQRESEEETQNPIPTPLQDGSFRFILIKHKSKQPIEKNWPTAANYRHDHSKIIDHIRKGGNYGVVCGYGGLIVLDADMEQLEKTIDQKLPPTFTVRTGSGGAHFYYRCPDLEKPIRLQDQNKTNIGDVQTWGKCAIGPGSTHPTGKKYTIEENQEIAEISAEELRLALSKFIKAVDIEKIKNRNQQQAKKHGLKHELNITDVVGTSQLKKRGNELQGPHPIHGSDTGQNFSINPAKNVWHCFRHNTGGGPLSWIAVREGIISCEQAKPRGLTGEKFRKTLAKVEKKHKTSNQPGAGEQKRKPELRKNGIESFRNEILALILQKDKPKARFKTAQKLKKDLHFLCPRENERLYRYNPQEGIYESDGKVLAKENTRKIWKEHASKHDIREIIAMLKEISYITREELGIAPGKVVVENGVLNLKDLELEPHSPRHRALRKMAVEYTPEATCPGFKEYLKNAMPEMEDRVRLQELLGTALVNKKMHKKGGVLVGPTDSGKTTLLKIIKGVFGDENTADLSINAMGDRWGKPKLETALINTTNEVDGESKLKRLDIIKKIMDGNTITVERKGQEPYDIEPTTEHLFAANQTPTANRKDDAFWNRWLVMEMPHKVKVKDQDPELVEKLLEEKQGILRWIVDGYQNFIENGGKFTFAEHWENARDKWLNYGDSIQRFIQKCIEKAEGEKITARKLHDIYSDFAEKHNLDVESQRKLTQEVQNVPFAKYSNKLRIDGKQQRGFKNIRINYDLCGDSGDSVNHIFM